MSDPLLGTTVAAQYRVEALLGEGGMCAVYRAQDVRKKCPVAIKVLPAARAAAPEMASRFQREVTTGKRIQHPNVVAISDSGTLDDGALYLVMELLDGRSLGALLTSGRVAVPRAMAIARQMLVGLAEAHRLGITHRDVKPENVILVDVGGTETVKLLDFGIAFNERAAVKLTAAGVAFGTPEYISPEMAMGLAVDARADLYAVGVVLFQMVTGRLPFASTEPAALLRAHVHERAPSPRAMVPDAAIPVELDALIRRALEKLPEDRFPTATAMIDALDAVPRARPSRGWGWLVALLVLALAGAAAWWYWDRYELTTAPEAPPAPKPVKKKPSHQR